MKRIAITIAALAISTSAFASTSTLFDVDADYNMYPTAVEDEGKNVAQDWISPDRKLSHASKRGLDYEIGVGDAESLFEVDADNNF